MRYAYIGLGHLGANLAACLLRAGFSVVVHDRNLTCWTTETNKT